MTPDQRHSAPYDRGSADSYYGRPFSPHYYASRTNTGPRITDLTPAQLADYAAGWEANEAAGDKKDWG